MWERFKRAFYAAYREANGQAEHERKTQDELADASIQALAAMFRAEAQTQAAERAVILAFHRSKDKHVH